MAEPSDAFKKFLKDFIWGGVSGAIGKTLTAPLNHVHFCMVHQKLDKKIRTGEEPGYSDMIDCAKRVYQKQGLLAFWSGGPRIHLFNCLRYFPTQMFNLATKDTYKKMFPKYNPKTEFAKFWGANLASGFLAAATSLAFVYPFDTVITAMTSDTCGRFRGPRDAIEKLSKGGLGAFYTGLGAALIGIPVYRAFQLLFFDKIVALNPWRGDTSEWGVWSKFICAQIAIMIGAGISYPFDTVRRRLTTDMILTLGDGLEPAYSGWLDCFRKIASEEGVAGFYRLFFVSWLTGIGGQVVMKIYATGKKMI